MSWLKDIKESLQEADKQKFEFEKLCRGEYTRLTPMVLALLKEVGKEWYGTWLFVNKFKIETLDGIFFWGIHRRGKGLESLPQRLNIKLKIVDSRSFFAIDAAFLNGPTVSDVTNDTTQESLKKAIIDLVSQT